ncbi:MAG TPA: hypothetical protein VGB64_11825 [Actinomycetota bacterium]
MKRFAAAAAAVIVVTSAGVLAPLPTARAVPVAADDALYQAYGRVFPDPHGCLRGMPGASPWAKGNVCAVQFLQWQEVLDGLGYLEERFDGLIDVVNLREAFANDPDFMADELQSAGLPREDLTRDKRDLYAIKITDASSTIPEAQRRHFAYSLSIHGIERAGIEGGIRAIEDLVTWAACERDAAASPACANEDVSPEKPKRILDAFDPPEGPTAGEVLGKGVVYFVLSNPDGWARGEVTDGGVFFQRYNGNGMDGNRDWPSIGYAQPEYTPGSEPETRGYAKYLLKERARTAAGRFAGAIDLHGMVTSHSFSFTLLGAGQRDYGKNHATVQTAITTWRDAEERLTWSPLVARNESCPGPLPEPFFGGTHGPMCTDLWGTVWDTIQYQVTGSFGDWMDSLMGLDAVGIDNEMAYSHLAPNTVFDPGIEQLHVDGNKGLIYAQIASLLDEKQVRFEPKGRIGYVFDPARLRDGGAAAVASPLAGLNVQDAIEHLAPNGLETFDFDVLGSTDGVYNGGMTIHATFTNARGISTDTLTTEGFVVEYCGPPDHPGDEEGCREVARYWNQANTYAQAGARVDLNAPKPGPYRISADDARLTPTAIEISFSRGEATPAGQAPFDVSRMDFFADLSRYAAEGKELRPVTVDQILADSTALGSLDSLVVAGAYMPGFGAGNGARYDGADRRRYTAALRSFAAGGGALILTDAALTGLELLEPKIKPGSVGRGYFYAGWMDFDDGEGPTYERHPLAAGVNKPGASEGFAEFDGTLYDNRHQTYEPGPVGYYISPNGSSNASCTVDRCDSPNWVVDEKIWRDAGGTIAARTFMHTVTEPPDEGDAPSRAGVSLGDLKLGKGTIRIAGALLPDATEQHYHPFGLSSYAVTYTGYQIFENAVGWRRAAPVAPPKVLPVKTRAPLPATGVGSSAALVALLAGLALAAGAWTRRGARA